MVTIRSTRSHPTPLVRVTLRLPDPLWREVQAAAAAEGSSAGSVLRAALVAHLRAPERSRR